MEIGPDGVVLRLVDVSPEDAQARQAAASRLVPTTLVPILICTVVAPQVAFTPIYIRAFSSGSATDHNPGSRMLLVLLMIPISIVALLTIVVVPAFIFKKGLLKKRVQYRYTIFTEGLLWETVMDGRVSRLAHIKTPLVPWRAVSPDVGDDFVGMKSDELGRIKVPSQCFETAEQRELFLSLAGKP